MYHCSNPEYRAKHGKDENGARANAIIKIAAMFDNGVRDDFLGDEEV